MNQNQQSEYSFLHLLIPLYGVAAQEPSSTEYLVWTADQLDVALKHLHEQLPIHKGGGWAVLSHNIVRLNQHLFVTFFLVRSKS